jgi:hypothetical protein
MKLKARDRQDLAVLSALLQDALVAVRDMTWQPREKRFVMVVNRFRWEAAPERVPATTEEELDAGGTAADAAFAQTPDRLFSRSFAGLRIERVEQAQLRGLDLKQRDRFLALLSLVLEPDGKALRLTFAEGVEIRLQLSRVSILLEDLGETWPTRWRPSHPDETEGGA